ncbi:MAG: hypothetical protein ABGZ37_11340 [Akkermansiaceae bacterium]
MAEVWEMDRGRSMGGSADGDVGIGGGDWTPLEICGQCRGGVRTIDRAEIEAWQRSAEFAAVRAQWEASPGVTIQLSGGTTADPLLWPRSQSDLEDIYERVARYYRALTGCNSVQRVALVGGVSHARVALNWRREEVEVRSFESGQVDELCAYDPDLLSCYPSIARELFPCPSELLLPSLRVLKLGGERLFVADVKRLHEGLQDVRIIEQFGSTELPALAFRCHRKGIFTTIYRLETERFDFSLNLAQDGWQALTAFDKFSDLALPLEGRYDTGDEALVKNGSVIDLRRVDDPSEPFWNLAEELLSKGVENLQVQPREALVSYSSRIELPPSMDWEGTTYRMERCEKLSRAEDSNKLPLVLHPVAP